MRRAFTSSATSLPSPKRHDDLAGLIGELLSQRVGEYRTILEEHAEEITDPASHPAATRIGTAPRSDLAMAAGLLWLPRMGGAELGLAGLLREAGVTHGGVSGAGGETADGRRGARIRGDPATRCLELFKAPQVVAAEFGVRRVPAISFRWTSRPRTTTWTAVTWWSLGAVRVRDGVVVEEFQRLVQANPAGEAPVPWRFTATPTKPSQTLRTLRRYGPSSVPLPQAICWSLTMDTGSTSRPAPAGEVTILRGMTSSRSTLCLSHKLLHPGSRALANLAHSFGIETGREHHALDDARTLAGVFLKLESQKLARARKTSLVSAIDHLAVALALSNPGEKSEARLFLDLGKLFALGRYSKALESYEAERGPPRRGERASARGTDRTAGRQNPHWRDSRKERTADERYPGRHGPSPSPARQRCLEHPSWGSSPIFWIGSHSPTPAEVRSWIGAA